MGNVFLSPSLLCSLAGGQSMDMRVEAATAACKAGQVGFGIWGTEAWCGENKS
jgi:hypothetical protein